MNPSSSPEQLTLSFFKVEEAKCSDPHWIASKEIREKAKRDVPVDPDLYECVELSEKVMTHETMLFIAPFSRKDMWDYVDVEWEYVNLKTDWGSTISRKIVTYLRHAAPLKNNKYKWTIPMDRGGWVEIRELAGFLKVSINTLINVLYAMSKDPKDRCQVAMLYRKDDKHTGPVWTNFGVALVRVCQGHSIPWILPERLGEEIEPLRVFDLCVLCHGTTRAALQHILCGSLKPASKVDPQTYVPPGSRSQRPATGSAPGKALVRNVLMMSPYPYTDELRYVSGARKESEAYIFLNTEKVANLMIEPIANCTLHTVQRSLPATIGLGNASRQSSYQAERNPKIR